MKKGFTLIELLAVIVILAIIALIATPIIINIIENAREESEKRSIELYASAIKNAIASYQLTQPNMPSSISDLTIEYDGNVVCSVAEIYEDGNIYLEDCTVNGSKVEGYTYGTQKEVLAKFSDVCTPVTTATTGNVPSGAYAIGDEYTCEVKEGTSYTFFVLSKEDNKVNLIMDSNVRKDGTPVKDTTDTGLVAWLVGEDFKAAGGVVTDEMLNDGGACQYGGICVDNAYGPLTAMKYLKNATSSWTKVSSIVETYNDEGGHFTNLKLTGHARMPKLSEVNNAGCTTSSGSCPLWMVNYLYAYTSKYPTRTAVSGVYGYWPLSSYASNSYSAWDVDYLGHVGNYNVNNVSNNGVRPVITLEI